jgi:hypothetical protein
MPEGFLARPWLPPRNANSFGAASFIRLALRARRKANRRRTRSLPEEHAASQNLMASRSHSATEYTPRPSAKREAGTKRSRTKYKKRARGQPRTRQILVRTEVDTERLFHSARVTCGHRRSHRADRLLSLVTFFAAAKKVTAAPHRGRLIDRSQSKFHGEFIRTTVFNRPTPPSPSCNERNRFNQRKP